MKRPSVDVENTPTTILTNIGVMNCLPKMARGGATLVTNKKHKPKKVSVS